MRTCGEYDLDDLLAVTAIPVTDYAIGTHDWQLQPTIPNTAFSPTLTNAIVIGQKPATTGGLLIPIKRSSGSASDSESDDVAGLKHSVTVECEADDRDPAVWNYLLQLERTPSHLLLHFRNGGRGFASASEDTYSCKVSRKSGKTSVKIDIENLMGIQLITV